MEIENFLYEIYSIYSIYQDSKDLPTKERQRNFELYLDEIESYGMPDSYIQITMHDSLQENPYAYKQAFGDILLVCSIRSLRKIEISLNSMWKNINVQ